MLQSHAIIRAKERYNISSKSFKRLIRRIVAKPEEIILYKRHLEEGVYMLLVNYRERKLPVIWDEKTQFVITVLPEEEVKAWELIQQKELEAIERKKKRLKDKANKNKSIYRIVKNSIMEQLIESCPKHMVKIVGDRIEVIA